SQLKVLDDRSNVLSLWKRYKSAVVTDINDLQIPGFARLATKIDKDHIAFLSLAAVTIPYTTTDGAAVLLPSPEGIKTLVNAFLSDQNIQQEAALVEVQGDTGKTGLASRAIDQIVSILRM